MPRLPDRKGPLLALSAVALGLWGYNASLIARGVAAAPDEAPLSRPQVDAPDEAGPLFEAGYPDPFQPLADLNTHEVRGTPGQAAPLGAAPAAALMGLPASDLAASAEPAWEPEPYVEPPPPPPALALRGVVGQRVLVADPAGTVRLLAPGDTIATATLVAVGDRSARFTHAGDPFTLSL